jgi:delta-aminolevulinic acid dehydratase/porphobilinogen synthase
MLQWHAAAAGAFGLAEGVNEALMGAKRSRAGATILITYFTPFLLKQIRLQQDNARTAATEAAAKGQLQL